MTNNQITYKRLGDYIREVNVRNRELRVNLSQGICNDKYFQNPKQVADNPETHKIVRTGQFAYNRATTRNRDKLSIALRQGPDCTVSAAYQVFEVSRPDLLLPEYLMMWFKRPEFDRLALFYSHGSAHEFFEWESMCDVQLPVPSIERQREIVSEYETLTRRIRLNEQIIEKLEATAQALYRKTFVDNIDKQNLPQGWHLATPISTPTSTPTSTPVNNLFTNSKLYTSNINILELVRVVGNEELSIKQMMENKGLKDRKNFLKYHLEPALKEWFVRLKYPDRPNHPRQKYLLTVKGVALYNELTKGE